MRVLDAGITVADLVEELGGAVLRVAAAPSDLRAPIGGVAVLDPSEPAEPARSELVIGIGVVPGPSGERLLSRLAAAGAAGLIVRERVATLLTAEADRLGVALLAVPASTDWTRVVILVGSLTARDSFDVPEQRPGGTGAGLTARELEVLRLVARGLGNQQISNALGIRVPTVERHLANVYPKIGVRSRTEAALYVLRHELI